jgi:DnaJ-class molecular chaperone
MAIATNPVTDYDLLDERPDRQPKYRRCLSCSGMFVSDGAHHRICPKCKGTAEWRSGDLPGSY